MEFKKNQLCIQKLKTNEVSHRTTTFFIFITLNYNITRSYQVLIHSMYDEIHFIYEILRLNARNNKFHLPSDLLQMFIWFLEIMLFTLFYLSK